MAKLPRQLPVQRGDGQKRRQAAVGLIGARVWRSCQGKVGRKAEQQKNLLDSIGHRGDRVARHDRHAHSVESFPCEGSLFLCDLPGRICFLLINDLSYPYRRVSEKTLCPQYGMSIFYVQIPPFVDTTPIIYRNVSLVKRSFLLFRNSAYPAASHPIYAYCGLRLSPFGAQRGKGRGTRCAAALQRGLPRVRCFIFLHFPAFRPWRNSNLIRARKPLVVFVPRAVFAVFAALFP